MPADAELAELLADVTWLRLLGQRLAGPDGDDLAQDTMLVALGKSRAVGVGLRPWLVVTARNIWRRRRRDENRRRARHAALEQPEPAVTADASLERLDTLAVVAELVRGLPDPYRATVLARYFEGKSAVAIAAEAGVPAGTVRWRLKEALERLRAALDERHAGDRRRWSLLLLPGVPAGRTPPTGTPALWPILAMVGLTTVAVSGALLRRPGSRARSAEAAPTAGHRPTGSGPARLAVETAAPEEAGAVVGVVRDPGGRPVAGAAVVLFPTRETTMATDPTRASQLEGWALTDAAGAFALEGRLPGAYVLTASHARFGPVEAPVRIGARSRERSELRLSPGGELLSGAVRDTGAGPVIGAQVTAIEFPGRGPQLHFGAVSGADGRYAMRLPRGHWHVGALAEGYAYAWSEVVLEGASSLNLALAPAAVISGRVIDRATGEPVPGALVRLDRAGEPWGRSTSTNAAGFFSFGTAWTPGGYRLTATMDDRVVRVEVPSHPDPLARAPVELAVGPGVSIDGRVVEGAGVAVAGALVLVFDGARQIQPVRQVKTDGDGRYHLGGLLTGPVWVGVEAAGRAPVRRRLVPAAAGGAVDFVMAGEAALLGVVTTEGGVPLGQADLRLTLLGSGPDAPLLAFRRVQTDVQGGFRIDGLAAGTFMVDVQSRSAGSGRFQGALSAAEHRRVTWRVRGPWSPDGRGHAAVVVGPW